MHWSWRDYEAIPLSVLAVLRDELIEEQRQAEHERDTAQASHESF